ncbi:MAG: hypothetical protein NC548_38350 [Lachnospiraceae bacterium]|nr:hypothetical protein [Lachnospiraceae bacterium]
MRTTYVNYSVKGLDGVHRFEWNADEDFSELLGYDFRLDNTKAVDIDAMDNLSNQSKILLSAVAGACIQHIIDTLPAHIPTITVFETGMLWISQED